MQVVEDVEEDVLGSRFPGKELYVIDDKDIDELVEMYKVIPGILLDRFDVLLGKFFRRDIQ